MAAFLALFIVLSAQSPAEQARSYLEDGNRRTAREYFLKNAELNPLDAHAFANMAAVDWAIVFEGTPETPEQREQLANEGLRYIDIALAIDPDYEDAIIYKNLLLREVGKLTFDLDDRARIFAEADYWFNKAIGIRQRNQNIRPQSAQRPSQSSSTSPPPPPPPPPPPSRFGVSPTIASRNLLYRPEVAYPPDALRARIQGSVLLEANVNGSGAVETVRIISGHPLLAEAAIENAKLWRFKPTLLNGRPVDVVTIITIEFRIP